MTVIEQVHAAKRLSAQIQPLLKGKGPDVQGAVLADLLSLYLAGHWPPELRDMVLAEFVKVVGHMVPISEHELFGDKGHPGRGHGANVVPFPYHRSDYDPPQGSA